MKYVIATALIFLLAIGVMVIGPRWANAQGTVNVALSCNKSEVIIAMLRDKYKEQVVGGGLTPGGGLIRLFVSDTDSFTVLVTSPDGSSCIMTGGEGWTTQKVKPLINGKDS